MHKFRRALQEIAKQNGISTKEVYREIQIAIDVAYQNHDPAIQTTWNQIPRSNEKPRPEDVIAYCAQQLGYK